MNLTDVERMLRERLEALGPAPRARAELLHVLLLPDFDRAGVIGDYSNTLTRNFAELLIYAEDSRYTRAELPKNCPRRR